MAHCCFATNIAICTAAATATAPTAAATATAAAAAAAVAAVSGRYLRTTTACLVSIITLNASMKSRTPVAQKAGRVFHWTYR